MGFGFVVARFGLLLESLQIGQPNLELRSVGLSPWFRHSSRLSRLQRFERQYALANRGHIRVRGDRDVTEADFARRHIVLFGDPGSNRLIAKLNGKLPLRWTKETVALGSRSFPAPESLPALIYPSPIYPNPHSQRYYVVINSGLTAAWPDWAGDFPTPRYGDYAVFNVTEGSDDPEAVYAGLFDESWKLR